MNDIEAMNAVRELVPRFIPCRAEPFVRRGRPTVAYRVDETDSGRVFVAKLQTNAAAVIEDTMCTHLFPDLNPVRSFGVYPSTTAGMSWLVTQFVAGYAFDPDDHVHRSVLADHMARVHGACADSSEVLGNLLPAEDTNEWVARTRVAIETVSTGLANDHVPAKAQESLHTLQSIFRHVQDNMVSFSKMANDLPITAVHGDLSISNVIVDDGRSVSVIDWATTRWGPPVADLAFVDLDTYRQALSPRWTIDSARLQDLQDFGCLLWLAHVIPGEREALASPWPERSLTKMDWYANWIGAKNLFRTRRGHEL